jgi:succinate dehydrogenase/fumarate reductase flavoprotein subunit
VADYHRKLELENLALTGYLIATAALQRTETRGQHRREDYPNGDDRVWLKEIGLTADAQGNAQADEQPVTLPRYRSRHLAHAEKIYAEFPR